MHAYCIHTHTMRVYIYNIYVLVRRRAHMYFICYMIAYVGWQLGLELMLMYMLYK